MFGIFLGLTQVINESEFFKKEKYLPFECGIENSKKIRIPFSNQFFFIGIVFVLFDIELVWYLHIYCIYTGRFMVRWRLLTIFFFIFLIVSVVIEINFNKLV